MNPPCPFLLKDQIEDQHHPPLFVSPLDHDPSSASLSSRPSFFHLLDHTQTNRETCRELKHGDQEVIIIRLYLNYFIFFFESPHNQFLSLIILFANLYCIIYAWSWYVQQNMPMITSRVAIFMIFTSLFLKYERYFLVGSVMNRTIDSHACTRTYGLILVGNQQLLKFVL